MGKGAWIDGKTILLVIAIALFFVLPWIFGWWIWTWMAPVTFWQKFFMLVAEFFIIMTLYGVEIMLIKMFD